MSYYTYFCLCHKPHKRPTKIYNMCLSLIVARTSLVGYLVLTKANFDCTELIEANTTISCSHAILHLTSWDILFYIVAVQKLFCVSYIFFKLVHFFKDFEICFYSPLSDNSFSTCVNCFFVKRFSGL